MAEKILIAEDERVSRNNLSRFLSEEGYEVAVARDGREAIDQIDQNLFDLVLTNMVMPGATGLDVLRHVRSVSPRTPTMIVSGYGSAETTTQARMLGACDYVFKPVDLDDLLARIKQHLGHRA
jgi:DNA-binding response OmpR family regulator